MPTPSARASIVEAPDAASTLEERLARIEALLAELVDRHSIREFYTIEVFARMVERNPYTVREWARLGRIHAEKKLSGREWVISHAERLRYEREGLLLEGTATSNGSLVVEGAS